MRGHNQECLVHPAASFLEESPKPAVQTLEWSPIDNVLNSFVKTRKQPVHSIGKKVLGC